VVVGAATAAVLALLVALLGVEQVALLLAAAAAAVAAVHPATRRSARDAVHRKAARGDGFRLRVVACDELTAFLSGGEGAREVARLLRDLADRGRAAGFVVLAATHRPASLALPAEFRDLFGVRWALRCSSSAAADALLGDGWRAQGFDPVQIGSRQAGVGYLLTDGGPPVRLRGHHLHQAQVRVLAERGAALHRAYLALAATTPRPDRPDGRNRPIR